jgi:hypothetical protein
MHRHLQLAAAALFTATSLSAQIHMPQLSHKEPKNTGEDVSWLAPYADPAPDGRGKDLLREPRLRGFIKDHLTAPQTFWNDNESLYETIYDLLENPNQVILRDDRYFVADGCVLAFCPSRGMLFIDTGAPHPTTAFAAIDWTKDNKTPNQSGAEYTLWLFSNRLLTTDDTPAAGTNPSPDTPMHIPSSLASAVAAWAAEPIPGTSTYQNITHVILVAPDGKPHQASPAAIGITPHAATASSTQQPTSTTQQPSTDTKPSGTGPNQ